MRQLFYTSLVRLLIVLILSNIGLFSIRVVNAETDLNTTLEIIEARLQDWQTQLTTSDRQIRSNTDLDELYTLKQQVLNFDMSVQAEFAQTLTQLQNLQMPEEIVQRHFDTVTAYQNNMTTLLNNLDTIINSSDTELSAKLEAALQHLQPLLTSGKHPEIDFDNLPFNFSKPAPALDENNISSTRQVRSSNTPDNNDLLPTEGVQITPEIETLAQQLNYDPIYIYNWVHDNIEFIPTYGAVQGSQMTLENRAGNATDTASLLIALLRASGIHARYAYGTVQIPIEKVTNWVKATNTDLAIQIFSLGGIPATSVTRAGQITHLKVKHTWVEAWVDFIPSRGAIHQEGDTWLPLDASFKQHQINSPIDIEGQVPFDAEGILDHIIDNAEYDETEGWTKGIDKDYLLNQFEAYQAQVETYLDQNHPTATSEDIFGLKTVIPANRPILAAGLPYTLITKNAVSASVPSALRHTFSVKLFDNATARHLDNPSLNVTLSLADLRSQRLNLTYIPASELDAQTLAEYQNNPSVTALPLYLLKVKPVLKLEDIVLAEGAAMTMGQAQEYSLTFTDPHQSYVQSGKVQAGDEVVFTVNGNGISLNMLQNRVDAYQDKLDKAETLHQLGLFFWFEHDLLDRIAADTYQIYNQRMPSVGVFFMPLTIQYAFGIPQTGTYGVRKVDVDRNVQVIAGGTEQDRFNFMSQIGIHGSYIEGSVLDQLFGQGWIPGRSTTQVLLEAAEQNIPIYTVTMDNVQAILPQLSLTPEVKQEVIEAVNAGKVVTIPQHDITHSNWTGIGYIIQDPVTGAGAYLIDGGFNGGSWEGCTINVLGSKGGFTLDPTIVVRKTIILDNFEEIQNKLQLGLALALFNAEQIQDEAQRQKEIDNINARFELLFDLNAKLLVMALTQIGAKVTLDNDENGEGCFVVKAKEDTEDSFFKKDELYLPLPIEDPDSSEPSKVTAKFTAGGLISCSDYSWTFGDGEGGSTEKEPYYTYTELGRYIVKASANCVGQSARQSDQIEVLVGQLEVDLQIEDIADKTEDTEGGLIQWNSNKDSNTNSNIEKGDDGVLTADLKVKPEGIKGSWHITFPDKLRVFEEQSGGKLVELTSGQPSPSMVVPADNVVAKLHIKAANHSESKNDITLKAVFTPENSDAFPVEDTSPRNDVIKLTSITIESVEWKEFDAPKSPIDDNPNWDGGKRIFAGNRVFTGPLASWAENSIIGNKVLIKATIAPVIEDIDIYFKIFDVDDPTPDYVDPDGDIDTNGRQGNDNHAALLISPTLASPIKTNTQGQALAEVELTIQPGDNFRVAATAIDSTALNSLTVTDVDSSYYIPTEDKQVTEFVGSISPMLTVWRKLWLELDSMESIPESGDQKNFDEGDTIKDAKHRIIIHYEGTPNEREEDVTDLYLDIQLTDSAGRYQRGFIIIGDNLKYTVLSNTNLHGKDGNGEIKGDIVTIEGKIDLSSVIGKPFKIYDDDYVTLNILGEQRKPITLPYSLASIDLSKEVKYQVGKYHRETYMDQYALFQSGQYSMIKTAYAEAYIDVLRIPDEFMKQPDGSFQKIPFKRNLEGKVLDFLWSYKNMYGDEYLWTAYLLAAFQPAKDRDDDPPSGLQTGLLGIAVERDKIGAIYLESIRETRYVEFWLQEAMVIAHEIGHMGGNGKGIIAGDHDRTGIMKSSASFVQEYFFQASRIKQFRLDALF
ncbi:transglutaminase domain-containing protein [Candidatus Albibeggiatoa sp. nov. NOAA]|uniref:transglutaminase domain-containing protein n=1 Tax=Candidatus Albibeggiatoa sp. nov. NOAA TaxID=3162724 RepID=UPI0032FDCB26|nr:hypothetical protein [Thiotrichaceae bacterium]